MDPIANARAQQNLNAAARSFMGYSFKQIADIMVAQAGSSFQADRFAANVSNIQVNRIGHTNEGGETVNTLLRVATAGTWNDVSFQIAAPSDRFRIILGLKFTLYALTDADVVGGANVEGGWVQQMIALGLVRLDRSRGRQTTQRSYQFLNGATNVRFVPSDDMPVEINRVPSETEILPLGFGTHLFAAVDAINPNDRSNFTITGLASVDVVGTYAADIGIGVDAIVADAVMAGM